MSTVARRARSEKDVWEEISGGYDILLTRQTRDQQPRLLRRLQLQGGDQQEKVASVGGERKPRASGQNAETGANLLLLDERPTISTSTLCARSRALLDFPAARSSSPRPFFLDRIATHMLAFEDDSHVEWFEGNFADTRKTRSGDWELTASFRIA